VKPAILVINSGSTSLKFALYEVSAENLKLRCKGSYTGMPKNAELKLKDPTGKISLSKQFTDQAVNHELALSQLIPILEKEYDDIEVKYAGHRIVSGGERFVHSVLLDDEVLDYLEGLSAIEPTHQHFEVMGARALAKVFPHVIQSASFDTSFHRTMPRVAEFYAVPEEIHQHGVRHWGFHGISYAYISSLLPDLVPDARKVITAHLGGGASICAMLDGRSIDTSMQFGAITGLPMATRSGDFPADALFYLLKQGKYSITELENILSKKSGLLALTGNFSEDMQQIEESDSEACQFARDTFDYMLLKYIGAYTAALNGLDVLIFTAGIGENDPALRKRICSRLDWMGVKIDDTKNNQAMGSIHPQKISTLDSAVTVYVIPTNEELMIAQSAIQLSYN